MRKAILSTVDRVLERDDVTSLNENSLRNAVLEVAQNVAQSETIRLLTIPICNSSSIIGEHSQKLGSSKSNL